jgi:hypothetical protein
MPRRFHLSPVPRRGKPSTEVGWDFTPSGETFNRGRLGLYPVGGNLQPRSVGTLPRRGKPSTEVGWNFCTAYEPLQRFIIHYSLFIIHYSLFVMHYYSGSVGTFVRRTGELRITNYELRIKN